SNDDAVGAVVVTGAGRAFCAGMDLSGEGNVFGLNEAFEPDIKDMRERLRDPEIEQGVRDLGGLLTLAIFRCKKPVIAAINGHAVGIGATMTCAMDARIIAKDAMMGFVFNRIGITPEACSTWFLPRIVNMGTALEWIYRADLIDSKELEKRGFVNYRVPGKKVLEKAHDLAGRIGRHSQVSVALARQMMYRNVALPHPREAHEVESLAIYYQSRTSGKEGVQAFREKRPPKFDDKASTDMPRFYPWWDEAEDS
ncbi:MAG: enoyl-CoA hydratase, partial [Acidimicrobiia bacterium]|nr:enoyl-CoA hydratase [Acidimicrobiia bacterium]